MSSRPKGIQQITGVRRSLTEDVKARQRRYLISMAVRTACFLLAVVTSGPLRYIFFAGSLILPYIAVVIANGGREPAQQAPRMADPARVAIEAPPPRTAPLKYDSLYYQPLPYEPVDDDRVYRDPAAETIRYDGDPDETSLTSR